MLPVVAIVATAQAPALPENLATIADRIAWDPAVRGALLLIGAEQTRPEGFIAPPRDATADSPEEADLRVAYRALFPAFPDPGDRGYSLDALALRFRRRLVRIGQVSTLARLVRRNPTPVPADPEAEESDENRTKRLIILLGSLTPGQWALAGGEGLGRTQLSPVQAATWDAMLPEELEVDFPVGRAPSAGRPPTVEDRARLRARLPVDPEALRGMDSVPLSPEQRGSLRLRLGRRLAVRAFFADAPDESDFDISEPLAEPESATQNVRLKGRSFAEIVARRLPPVPAVAKPSAIHFQAAGLDPAVPLAGVATVGELVARISRRTGVPVIADARWASVSVRARGESARAGDLLQALARGIDGAVRRLGDGDQSLYLLTDDAVPGALRDAQDNEKLFADMGGELAHGLVLARDSAAGLRSLGASQEPFRLSRVGGADLPESLWREPHRSIGIAELPVGYRTRLRDAWAEADEETRSTKLPPDRIRAKHFLEARLVLTELGGVADIGKIDLTEAFEAASAPEVVAPVAWPEKFTVRAAALALPTSEAERTALLESAVRLGLTHVFVPADRADSAAIGALGAAAKARRIGVVPTLAPLTGPANPPEAPRDVSLAGRTARQWTQSATARAIARSTPPLANWIAWLGESDFVVPEAIDPATVARKVEALSALPGISFIALRDLGSGVDTSETRAFLWSGGATMGVRRRFVLEHGIDPADLHSVPDALFYDSSAQGMQTWYQDQTARHANVLARIDAAVRPSTLPVPLLVLTRGGRTEVEFLLDIPQPHWERWTGKPARPLYDDAEPGALRLCKVDPIDFDLSFLSPEKLDAGALLRPVNEQFRAWVRASLTERDWSGGVIDLSRLPLAPALALLDSTIAPR